MVQGAGIRDQTLCAWNADNALVENLSMAEGVVALTRDSVLRLETHERLGALPSLTVSKPDDVLKPNPAVRRVFDRAKA